MSTGSARRQGGARADGGAAHDRTPSPVRGSALWRPHATPVKTSRCATPLAKDQGKEALADVGPQAPPGLPAAAAERPPGLAAPGGAAGGAAAAGAELQACGQANAQRSARVLEIMLEALRDPQATEWADKEGYVSITKLLRYYPDLQRETFGSTRVIAHAVEGQATKAVRLDKARRRVRLQSIREMILERAEAVLEAAPRGVVPLRAILEAPPLREALAGLADPVQEARQALEHEESPGVVRGEFVQRHPKGARLRRRVEELLSDESLAVDSRLRAKVAESPTGEVPLMWICSRYASRLERGADTSAAGLEVSGAELYEALKHSAQLYVDGKRLTVSRKRRLPPHLAAAGSGPSPRAAASSAAEKGSSATTPKGGGGGGAGRAEQTLRQLLDFYFEPFTLQHNRYLLDLLARSVGRPAESGPWVPDALRAFSCSLEDLNGLGRVSAALAKLHVLPRERQPPTPDLDGLKHLSCGADGQLRFLRPPEVRSFVAAPDAPPGSFDAAVRYLAAAREERGAAPERLVSVTSYAVAGPLADDAAQGPQRCARLKRQLVVHHTDLVCLQGLDPEAGGASKSLAEALLGEGYAYACSRDGKDANAIFWDRGRWELVESSQVGAAVAVVLRPFEDLSARLRAVCLRPDVPCRGALCLQGLFGGAGGRRGPLVACADLQLLGGAECASVAEELAYMSSVAQEVLGEEILCPMLAPTPSSGIPKPLLSNSSGLNRLCSPDAMLFEGMAPVAVLSGHTEGYLATLPAEEVVQQFPACRMPLVAAYNWHVELAESPASAAGQKELFRI